MDFVSNNIKLFSYYFTVSRLMSNYSYYFATLFHRIIEPILGLYLQAVRRPILCIPVNSPGFTGSLQVFHQISRSPG